MSTDPHAIDVPDHSSADGGEHHVADLHGDGEEPLGPIDAAAWLAGALGVVLGLAVTICFVLATAGTGSVAG